MLVSICGNPDIAFRAMPSGPATTMGRPWRIAQPITDQVSITAPAGAGATTITAQAGAGAATGGETWAQGRLGFTNPSRAVRDRLRY